MTHTEFLPMPDENGFFGQYGGQAIPPELKSIMDDINQAYLDIKDSSEFKEELAD